ncbi:hypothetical protein OBBRIDRAFT_836408 [Obba rivulosa]|uniref:Uncharacterized protein n=1 Tax=Obba rivulosa TaxID=1052685 RepID=A0A8E2AV52_9APHY|nr:hypothetical protein OBBRIDRAFT_836408 [Obba rivulosa]
MPPAPSPSALIADALASLSKATNLAFSTVEDNARAEVARARADAEKARAERDGAHNERDEARVALQELRIEEKEWMRRIEGLKASLDKADITIKHQTETIAQLRAEVQQWKLQLARLEETSRQEVLAWKEQCMRANDERCRLSVRVDELVAEQLARNTNANASLALAATPYPARTPYRTLPPGPDTLEPSATSTLTRRASSSLAHSESMPPLPARRSKPASHIQRPPSPAPSAGGPSRVPRQKVQAHADAPQKPPHTPVAQPAASARPPSQPRVIRRVHAVVEVKQESSEDEDVPLPPTRVARSASRGAYVPGDEMGEAEESEGSGDGSEYEPDAPVRAQPRRNSQGLQHAERRRRKNAVRPPGQVRKRAVDSEDEHGGGGDGKENVGRRMARARARLQDDDDEDDELLMGPDTSREEYPQSVQKPRASIVKTPASKKRKLEGEQNVNSVKTSATKVARR